MDDVWKDFKSDSSDGEATPDPTYHWAVLVGDYHHELAIDSDIDCTYRNGLIAKKSVDWRISDFGITTWNDQAIVEAGKVVAYARISGF